MALLPSHLHSVRTLKVTRNDGDSSNARHGSATVLPSSRLQTAADNSLLRNQQKAFFTERAGLTEDEANAFFPLYNELQQKKRELNRETRRIMRQEGGAATSEEQSLKAIDAIAETNIKIAELEKEYLQKFKKVLPASKILKVQNAEEQFNSQILKDIQQSRGHQFQQVQPRPGQPQRVQQPQFYRSRQNNQ